jgi:hypothetical protein
VELGLALARDVFDTVGWGGGSRGRAGRRRRSRLGSARLGGDIDSGSAWLGRNIGGRGAGLGSRRGRRAGDRGSVVTRSLGERGLGRSLGRARSWGSVVTRSLGERWLGRSLRAGGNGSDLVAVWRGADFLFANRGFCRVTGSDIDGLGHDIEIDLRDHDALVEGLGHGTQGKGGGQDNGRAGTHFEWIALLALIEAKVRRLVLTEVDW